MLNNIFQFLAAGPVRPALEAAFVLVPKVFIPAAWFNPANLAESIKTRLNILFIPTLPAKAIFLKNAENAEQCYPVSLKPLNRL